MPGNGRKGAKKRKIIRNEVLTNKTILRLARQGGVKRLSNLVYDETRSMLRIFLENVIRDSFTYAIHDNRATITAFDVSNALKKQGKTLKGFDG